MYGKILFIAMCIGVLLLSVAEMERPEYSKIIASNPLLGEKYQPIIRSPSFFEYLMAAQVSSRFPTGIFQTWGRDFEIEPDTNYTLTEDLLREVTKGIPSPYWIKFANTESEAEARYLSKWLHMKWDAERTLSRLGSWSRFGMYILHYLLLALPWLILVGGLSLPRRWHTKLTAFIKIMGHAMFYEKSGAPKPYVMPAIIVAILLFVALGKLPDGYFIFLRWVVCAAAVLVAYMAGWTRKVWWIVWLFATVAIIFNPITPIPLDRSTWLVIDIGAAIAFLASIFFDGLAQRQKEKENA